MGKFFKNSRLTKAALLIYFVVLTFLLFKPANLEEMPWFVFDGIDKLIHLSIFAVLGFLFMLVFSRTKFLVFVQIMLIYALFTEVMQQTMRMGRSMEDLDVVADLLGVCIGYYIYKIVSKKFTKNIEDEI